MREIGVSGRAARVIRFLGAAGLGVLLTLGVQRAHLPPPEPAPAPATGAEVLATVDGRPITVADYLAELQRRGGSVAYPAPEHQRALLDEMVGEVVMSAAARRAGYDRDPDVLQRFERLLAETYRRERVDPELAAVQVDDAEVRAFYDQHLARFTDPEAAQVAMIVFAVAADADAADRQAAAERAARVRAAAEQQAPAADFGPLAADYSDDQSSRYRGGDVGWVVRGDAHTRWEPAVLDAMFALGEPGALSPVISGEHGLYLIRLLARRPAAPRPLAQVAPGIAQRLLAERRAARAQALQDEAAAGVAIVVDEARLADIGRQLPAVAEQPLEPPPLPNG